MTTLLALALLSLAPLAPQDEPPEVRAAREVFAEARALSDADGGALWGRALYGPMLLVDPLGRRVFANEAVESEEAGLVAHGDVFAGPLPAGVLAANAAQEWQGRRWTTLIWQGVPRSPYRRRILLVHEMFHRVQPELGLSASSPSCEHLDTPDGRAWLRLELRALCAALLASGEARNAAARDALLFRARRHELFVAAAASERAHELVEGLAQYTGMRLSLLPASSQATWTAQWIADVESQEGADPIWLKRRLAGSEDPASFARTFPYATGAAYGLLLDALAPGWLAKVDASADLAAALAKALAVEPPAERADLAAAAAQRAGSYEGRRIEEEERRWQESLEERRRAYRERLVDGPVLRLPLRGKKSLAFQSDELTSLPGAGRVYRTLDARAAWGALRVEAGGALGRLEPDGGVSELAVRAPGDADLARRPLAGDGWTLELAPGWEIVPGERPGDLVARERP